MRRWAVAALCCVALSGAPAGRTEILYWSNFDSERLGSLPTGWEKLWDGTTTASVIREPGNAANYVLSSSDLAHDKSRHDVGGSIFGVGDETWTDYVVIYDALFPVDFYMGVLFRYTDEANFYLFDRRSGAEAGTFDFWHQSDGWNRLGTGQYDARPREWHTFMLSIQGDRFEAYAYSWAEGSGQVDGVPFESADPIATGSDASLAAGPFALYGLIYIDNLIVAEELYDLGSTVRPAGKLTTTWAAARR